jgi:predicted Zn-dependent protease
MDLCQALLQEENGNERSFLDLLQKTVRLRPGDSHSLVLAAEIFFRQKKTDPQVEQMRALLAKNSGSAESHYYLGLAAERLGNRDEAKLHFVEPESVSGSQSVSAFEILLNQ